MNTPPNKLFKCRPEREIHFFPQGVKCVHFQSPISLVIRLISGSWFYCPGQTMNLKFNVIKRILWDITFVFVQFIEVKKLFKKNVSLNS